MTATEGSPNVLLLLTDQERYDYTAPDGPPVETRAIDRLAAEGMRFTQAITPTSICSSARASLLTGQFPHAHGMVNNCHEADAIRSNLPTDVPTFSGALAAGGYDCTYTGKWHVGHDATPEAFGFRYLGGSDRHHDDIDEAFAHYREDHGAPLGSVEFEDAIYTAGDDGTFVAATTPVDVEHTRAYFLAQRTIEAIEAHASESDGDERESVDSDDGSASADADDERASATSDDEAADTGTGADGPADTPFETPFFHRADFYGPHHPYVIPEPYASMYDPDEIELPASFAETFAGKPRVHERYLEYRGVADFDRETWRRVIAAYRGFVSLVDDQIGRVLDALESAGLAEETVVVHTSDHGDFVGSHRQFNKGPLAYDDTYRIPLHVRWPGVVEPGSICDTPVHLHDLAPTFCEVGGVDVPETMQTASLVPLLTGEKSEWDRNARPESAFAGYAGDEFGLYTQRMVRTPRFKYVYNGPDIDECYDLAADPAELQNLIDHPGYAAQRARLIEELVDWMDRTDDPYREWVGESLSRRM